jgi:calcineurin-like phosphoesterase family protein
MKINYDENKIWFSSDHHFAHKNIIKYEKRPFGYFEGIQDISDEQIQLHDMALINNWNNNVKKDDIVFYCGDLFMGKCRNYLRDILDILNGKIYYIFGNHDQILRKNLDLQKRFVFCGDYLEIDINKKTYITLTHYAMRIWNRRHYGSWNLFGHSHNNLPDNNDRSMDIGIDAIYAKTNNIKDFRPISYLEVKEILKDRTNIPMDHHI